MSRKFTPIAVCRTSTCPEPGVPASTSSSCRTSGGPWRLMRIARVFTCFSRSCDDGHAFEGLQHTTSRALDVLLRDGDGLALVAGLDRVDQGAMLGHEI